MHRSAMVFVQPSVELEGVMKVIFRALNILGLAILVLLMGAMRFDVVVQPMHVSAPPAIITQVLEALG